MWKSDGWRRWRGVVGVGSVKRKGVVCASESVLNARRQSEDSRWCSMLREWWKGSGEGKQQREREEAVGRLGRGVGTRKQVMVVTRM